jgi:hypothetical protein
MSLVTSIGMVRQIGSAGGRQHAARRENATARFEVEPGGIRRFVLRFDCSVRVKRQELTTDD